MPRSYTKRPSASPIPFYLRSTGTPWTPEQEARLLFLVRGNTPTRVIGFKLGRSEGAIRHKAADLRLSLKPVNRSPYGRRA